MSAHDFDFLHGSWRISHRYLKDRLVGCHEWQEFSSGAPIARRHHGHLPLSVVGHTPDSARWEQALSADDGTRAAKRTGS